MAKNRPKHCRIYKNGNSLSIHINKELADTIKECFPAKHDYLVSFDPIKETLTIFKPVAPS